MRRRPNTPRALFDGRLLAAAIAAAFCLAGQAATTAGTVSPEPARHGRESAGLHRCKCSRVCQGGSCCCTKAGRTAERTAPSPGRAVSSGPTDYVGPAPCGGDGQSDPARGWTAVRTAALGLPTTPLGDTRASYRPVPSETLHPSHRTSRIDEPPDATPPL